MKKINLLLSITLLLALVACGNKADTPESIAKEIQEGKTSFKTFYIEQQTSTGMEGMSFTMHTKIWHDTKQEKSASEITTETVINGQSSIKRNLYIEDNEGYYSINLDNKTGVRIAEKNQDNIFSQYSEDEEIIDDLFGDDSKIIGRESYIGKPCVIYETYEMDDDEQKQKIVIWMYKGIPLKVVSEHFSVETIKIEENPKIPASKFKVPDGIVIK